MLPREDQYIPVVNNDEQPVPPFGLMRITSINAEGYATVERPDRDGQVGLLINGPVAIPVGAEGGGHQIFPAVVSYALDNEEYEDPAAGEPWGAKADSWELHRGQYGYYILGGAGVSTHGVRLVNVMEWKPETAMIFVETGAVPDSNGLYDGVIHVLNSQTLAWTDTGIEVKVLNAN